MKRMFIPLVFAAVVFTLIQPMPAQAMTVEMQGNQVFATGPVEDDLRKFEEAFSKPGIDTVVFVNSPGGDLWTGLRVGRLIADKGYTTVIAGTCISACSIMFMGGKQRQFSDAFRPNQTFIGIHGAHDKDTKAINPAMQPQIFAFYKLRMDEKFNAAVMNLALYEMDDAGAMLRVFDPVRSSKTPPHHCRSSQTPRDKCSKIEGPDALSLGIVTSSELLKVNLPPSFKLSPTVFGRELTADTADLASTLLAIAQSKCVLPACKDSVTQFAGRAEHRAVATAIHSTGVGLAGNADSPTGAAVRAIFNCNHASNPMARLCEVKIVNGVDLSTLYAESDAAHAKALALLKPPADKFYANEEFGGSFTQANGLRKEKLNDITPQNLDGIKTIATQELAGKLAAASGSLNLIDVIGLFETIPSAKVLLNAGSAPEGTTADEAFDRRFAALLSVTVPDKTSPVVFFCGGRNCWLSANAAMRARQLGYSQVLWYRGGIESWKAAGLPLVPGAVRAVVK